MLHQFSQQRTISGFDVLRRGGVMGKEMKKMQKTQKTQKTKKVHRLLSTLFIILAVSVLFQVQGMGVTFGDEPDPAVTRGELAHFLVETFGFENDEASSNFTDVPADHPYYKDISILWCEDILNGYPDGSFQPEGPVTRAEYAVLLTRLIDPELNTLNLQYVDFNDFQDALADR
jgi:hypothetical protein